MVSIHIILVKKSKLQIMKVKTISILGIGWLGLPLSKSLQSKGYYVKGSVTSNEKKEMLKNSKLELSILKIFDDHMECSHPDFFDTDILIVNFPPKRTPNIETIYPAQIQQILPHIYANKIEKILFISSTSVYPECNKTVFENEESLPETSNGMACLNAENILFLNNKFSTSIIRFGGLIGPDRNPNRFLKSGIKKGSGQKPVNLIHIDDCIRIINVIIEQNIWGEIINGCSPEHPTRETFYTKAAELAGMERPVFENPASFRFKKVSSEKLINQFGYSFKYISPLDFI